MSRMQMKVCHCKCVVCFMLCAGVYGFCAHVSVFVFMCLRLRVTLHVCVCVCVCLRWDLRLWRSGIIALGLCD